jgi:hypothetical protein
VTGHPVDSRARPLMLTSWGRRSAAVPSQRAHGPGPH